MKKDKKDYEKLNAKAIADNNFSEILRINSRFINTIANKRAFGCDFLFDEFKSIIMYSLWKAFKSYLSNDNITFIQYASGIIRNDLTTYLRTHNDLIRIPRKLQELLNNGNLERIQILDYEMELNDEPGLKLIDTIIQDEIKQLDLTSIQEAIEDLRLYKEKWANIIEHYHGLNNKEQLNFSQLAPIFKMTKAGVNDQYHFGIRWLKKNEKLKIKFKRDNE
jgi:RNA polymerase sigma factor (sigma-70 family)